MTTEPPPYPLIDGYDEGYIEDHAWVPVAHAATPEAAETWLRRMCPEEVEALEDSAQTIRATGERAWHREAGCSACEGTGADEYSYPGDVPIQPFPACESCLGTGAQSPGSDYFAWESCKPDSPGAVEFWRMEVEDVRAVAGT
jgi:hypothetical protein